MNGDSISELMGIAVSMGFSEEITSHALADMRRRGKNFNPFVISTSSCGAPGKLTSCLGELHGLKKHKHSSLCVTKAVIWESLSQLDN